MYKNMRYIKNIISETKIRNPLSIQLEAWKGNIKLHQQPEDFECCFKGTKLHQDTLNDTSYYHLLSSTALTHMYKSQDAFDTASYLRLAHNVKKMVNPRITK